MSNTVFERRRLRREIERRLAELAPFFHDELGEEERVQGPEVTGTDSDSDSETGAVNLEASSDPEGLPLLREKFAALEHGRWSRWMVYLFDQCFPTEGGGRLIPKSFVEHWQRQLETHYNDLSEREKDSDRKEADGTMRVLLGEENPLERGR